MASANAGDNRLVLCLRGAWNGLKLASELAPRGAALAISSRKVLNNYRRSDWGQRTVNPWLSSALIFGQAYDHD